MAEAGTRSVRGLRPGPTGPRGSAMDRSGVMAVVAVALALSVQACAPPPPAAPGSSGNESGGTSPARPSRVIIGVRSDVSNLSSKLSTDNTSATTSGNQRFLSNSPLVVFDSLGNAL